MSEIVINSSKVGSQLASIMLADDLQPGDDVSYQVCKTLYLYHPLGAKMAESPISKAQSQAREISISDGPEEMCREQFLSTWEALGAEDHIHNVHKTARIYGVASLAILTDKTPVHEPIDYRDLHKMEVVFNVLDPLNTAGSLVLNQDPNAMDFQKNIGGISVSGKNYHRSRAVVVMNEKPIYIGYTNSAFGYVGRSVYQRSLYPLKSFIQSMITDDMVTRKAGVIVAKLKAIGSIATNAMMSAIGMKRQAIKLSSTNNVVSITAPDEALESLNLQNLEGPAKMARMNILENIAVSADMPAQMLNSETFAEGFGEGTEDAKNVAGYIDRVRREMAPTYRFMDTVCMYMAWTPEFYRTIQNRYPEEYGSVSYTAAFYRWMNSFKAMWPSLLTEPDSEKIKVEETKFKSIVEMLTVLLPKLPPDAAAELIMWAQDNFNENKMLFTTPLQLNAESIEAYLTEVQDRTRQMEDDAADAANAGDGADDDEDGDTGVRMPKARADSIVAPAAIPLVMPKFLTDRSAARG